MTENPKKTSDREYYMFAVRIVGDFGATIAFPVVILVMIGQYLGTKYHHEQLFTITAFILAALTSGKIIYRRTAERKTAGRVRRSSDEQ